MSVGQAERFLDAIDSFLSTDADSLSPAQMVNFELHTGILDMGAGNEKFRPFQKLTFFAVCSVTRKGKTFKTVFPGSYGSGQIFRTFNLNEEQVKNLRGAIYSTLEKTSSKGSEVPAGKEPA